jgi:hypothetical protein
MHAILKMTVMQYGHHLLPHGTSTRQSAMERVRVDISQKLKIFIAADKLPSPPRRETMSDTGACVGRLQRDFAGARMGIAFGNEPRLPQARLGSRQLRIQT